MESRVIKITPDMAKTMLERNMKNNRPVLKSTVHSYARMMKNGNWNLTHQGIAFDEQGELIDGQHRLHAIIEANTPVNMLVTYNVHHAPGEIFTIDMGRKRTYSNIALMSGIDDPVFRYTGPSVSAYIRYKIPGAHRADPAEIVDYIERHYDDVRKLYEIMGGSTHGHGFKSGDCRIPALVGAAILSAIYRGESYNALVQFSQVYRYNEVSGCEGYNPKYVLNLRDYVRHYRSSNDLCARCESTIYAFVHNISHFRVRENCYPFNQGLDA